MHRGRCLPAPAGAPDRKRRGLRRRVRRFASAPALAPAGLLTHALAAAKPQEALTAPDPIAASVDPYLQPPPVLVMAVRLLLYSDEGVLEGIAATTSAWMPNRVRPNVIQAVLDACDQVRPNARAVGQPPRFVPAAPERARAAWS